MKKWDSNNQQFVHLKGHTEYSIRDGLLRIRSLIEKVEHLHMPAIAITDHVNLFGLVKFYRAALAAGVKPIIGADLLIQVDKEIFTVTALCQNFVGYQNLTRIISRAYLSATADPLIQWQWLVEANEGLIILSGEKYGDVGQAVLSGQLKLAEQRLQNWQQIFQNRYYIELQRLNRAQEEEYIHAILPLAEKLQLPVVATNDVRFLERDDFEAHEARVCIHDGYVLEDTNRPKRYSEEQYLRSAAEMQALFADIPEALMNTVEIAKRCSLEMHFDVPYLPRFPLPANESLEKYLLQQTQKGLNQFLPKIPLEKHDLYNDRLKLELDVINKMGFAGYFLIVADFIQWSRQQKIPVGPGRGSGAGSLVAYALGITALDPIEHELLFERFLNPERVSMPDFDIDFCMDGRDRVIDYVAHRYGREAVSQIITYGTMAAKAVIRDVGRVLGMPYGFVDKIAKLIPFELGMTLAKALQQEPQLAERYKNEEEVATLINLAKKLEGLTRNAGKHAGGVVIAPTQLTDFTPLYCEPGGDPVTQFDKDDVEAIGLVKFDFLGLRTLTIIDKALLSINARRLKNKETPIDIENIPLGDVKTYELLKNCATTAVFQLESRGMKDLVRRLQPDSFEEITALVALFRPGPLQSGMVDDFINRKHGRAEVFYLHHQLEPILRSTYGVILYQEQVMQIAQVLAGYSLGGADILRRAMGKKKPQEMAKQRAIFIDGATKNNIDAHIAGQIFDLMEKFAGYGFNKSHSAAYALIAYQTAWLKAHFPAEFMAAVLSSDMDNTDKVVSFLTECKEMNLTVIFPDINRSYYHFTVNEQNQIEYGLGAIKGVGEAAAIHIAEERESNGPYSDLFSFCQRLDLHKINRRALEPLIYSGAMDGFNIPRASIFASLEKAIKLAEQSLKNKNQGQKDLFGDVLAAVHEQSTIEYVAAPNWDELTQLRYEKEVLGTFRSGHPLYAYLPELKQLNTLAITDLLLYIRKNISTAGMITKIRYIQTKTGKRMGIVQLADQTGKIDITVFSDLLEKIRNQLQEDQIFIVKGKVEEDDFSGGIKMVAESMELLADVRARNGKRLVISLKNAAEAEQCMRDLPDIIKPFRGGACPITLYYRTDQAQTELQLGHEWRVQLKSDLFEQLKNRLGEQVAVEY